MTKYLVHNVKFQVKVFGVFRLKMTNTKKIHDNDPRPESRLNCQNA